MKKLLIILIGSFTLSAAAPALAGPDWQIIEKARKDKQAAVQPAQHASSLPPIRCTRRMSCGPAGAATRPRTTGGYEPLHQSIAQRAPRSTVEGLRVKDQVSRRWPQA